MGRKIFIIGIGCVSLIVIGVIIALALTGGAAFRLWQLEWKKQGETDMRFVEVALPFTHNADLDNSLPFMASAAIDVDGDGVEELFLGGGKDQSDAFFGYKRGKGFVSLGVDYRLAKSAADATHGAASIDVDKDGNIDLFVTRESGVWLHRNVGDGFTSENLNLPLANNTTPLSIALGDVNKDGFVDFYISGYIKNDLVEGQAVFTRPYGGYSHLFLNNGDDTWRDVSKEAGVWRQHNTFTAMFVDIDNDHDSDLVVAQDTGVVETYENTGAFPFRRIDNPSVNSYPMGIGAGDYDNDGFIDFYFSNVGHTLPEKLLRGDLGNDDLFNPSYMLFRNRSGEGFEDVARQTRTARIGFGWGVAVADINLDGRQDLLAAQNYARFPGRNFLHKYACKIMLQYSDGEFMPVEKRVGAVNRSYAVAPIVADFNDDGRPDLIWANIDGPAKAFMSGVKTGNWIKIRLPDAPSSLGAIVTTTTPDGLTRTQQFLSGEGLGSDQSAEIIVGLGNEKEASIEVQFQNGVVKRADNVSAGERLSISAER